MGRDGQQQENRAADRTYRMRSAIHNEPSDWSGIGQSPDPIEFVDRAGADSERCALVNLDAGDLPAIRKRPCRVSVAGRHEPHPDYVTSIEVSENSYAGEETAGISR